MLNAVFSHSLIRKYVAIFGNMFNEIYINHDDKTILVPLHYGPREKWLSLIDKPLIERKTAVTLPIISFQISSIYFDINRKNSPLNKIISMKNENRSMRSVYQFMPYKLGFELHIMAKTAMDVTQIFEQIAPFFTPSFTNTANIIPELDKKFDIVTRLVGVSMEDNYTGDFNTRRSIMWTLSFEMDIFLLGPVTNQGVIKKIDIDIVENNLTSKYIVDTPYEHVTITPGLTVTGNPTTDKSKAIDYHEVKSTDNFAFLEEWESHVE